MTSTLAPPPAGTRPVARPRRPFFSTGPCAKPPGWSLEGLQGALLGRSHRSKPGKARLKAVIEAVRRTLEVPADHLIAITPASDTGAVEMAMWSLLGPRPVQVLAFESFSRDWAVDAVRQLKLDAEVLEAPYGRLPDLSRVVPDRDLVLAWNGTTSGVRIPDGDFISANREGIVICDATSACFAQRLPWDKLDAVTFSWQKVLGGEAAHGVLILSPRAVARLETWTPAWPMPKLFRLTKGGRLDREIFEGATINTPSMLCVEDALQVLSWAEGAGGLEGLIARADRNLHALAAWVETSDWADFLAVDPRTRSNTSACLRIVHPEVAARPAAAQDAFAKALVARVEAEGAGFDLGAYRDAPPGLRIWCGATVETEDLLALLPWLDWAFVETLASEPRA